jgi:hypothetical protein
MNNLKFHIYIILLLFLQTGCKQEKIKLVENSKLIDPNVLVSKLRKEELIETFKNYTIVPRNKSTNSYIFSHTKNPQIDYYLGYDEKGPEYFKMNNDSKKKILEILRKNNPNNYKIKNTEYLNDAYTLITAMKILNIQNVNSIKNVCYFTFNNYQELIYIDDSSKIDERLTKRIKDFKRIDKNFLYQ